MTLNIMLGGVPIVTHAGAQQQTEEPLGAGSVVLRLSGGAGVKQQHWQRMSGTITGQGLMPPGLDGLDYSQPLELRSTQVSSIVGAGLEFSLTSVPRPELAPWAFALVDNQWGRTPCAYANGVVTVEAVPGATLYQACWLPIYSVFATRPPKTQSTAHGWSINWEET
ncbi:hypothetical protein CXF92_18510 [Pseudomonas sp. Choline-3u-10]|uniref:Putative tail tape measure protein n=1 Tax=viral metagenome TaxID=1070528 RepID=A0A6H1ZK93_9ZZZZ|nr:MULTISPECIES: hypothetical protein [Pseudomonadaceae]MBK3797543.1 hypothetical protein [Stutzerimonas stutzeri]MBK3876382.1 hypothetical protein [Stutzerimonas stutzeri]PKG90911.1 hypothetical protein CXF92_18510 [Pseudomonas sp. Choline-3u-10]|tara:strand:+ start:3030 stop:3530 length:501 start_codon:yes stop_codon:yes gene_type:complete